MMGELWDDLKKNKPLLIAVLAGIGIFLYVIYKNGPGAIAPSIPTSGGHTTYVEGSEVHAGPPGPPGPPGPKGPKWPRIPGPKPKKPPKGGLTVATRKVGTLESAPHVPLFHGGQIVTVPAGAIVEITGTEINDSAGKQYWGVIWNHIAGLLGNDVVTP